MFELELIGLINQYKKSEDEYDKKKIKSSISKLITEHEEDYNNFLQKQNLDEQTKNLLNESKKDIEKENNEKKDPENDIEIVKRYYLQWLNEYNKNNLETNQECERLVQELINFYIKNRFNTLMRILDMNDDESFEAFKWHMKNQLRLYFALKVEEYIESEKFEQLSFWKKFKKKKGIKQFLKEITKYNFNMKFFNWVINDE